MWDDSESILLLFSPTAFILLMKNTNSMVLGVVFVLSMSFMGTAVAETVTYQGDISSAQNRDFFKRVQNQAIDRLVITSAGGEVEAATYP